MLTKPRGYTGTRVEMTGIFCQNPGESLVRGVATARSRSYPSVTPLWRVGGCVHCVYTAGLCVPSLGLARLCAVRHGRTGALWRSVSFSRANSPRPAPRPKAGPGWPRARQGNEVTHSPRSRPRRGGGLMPSGEESAGRGPLCPAATPRVSASADERALRAPRPEPYPLTGACNRGLSV